MGKPQITVDIFAVKDAVAFMALLEARANSNFPGALLRGGSFVSRSQAGPFAIAAFPPSHSSILVGFRCAR